MSRPWKPNVTVAAVIEHDGRFLLVEEETNQGIRLNQPAGHLDPGESLVEACARETLEETAYRFTPQALLGVYMWSAPAPDSSQAVTFLRFAFAGNLGVHEVGRALDHGIVQAVWLTPQEIRARSAEHRSPLVMQCLADFIRGQRFPLDLLHTHPSARQ